MDKKNKNTGNIESNKKSISNPKNKDYDNIMKNSFVKKNETLVWLISVLIALIAAIIMIVDYIDKKEENYCNYEFDKINTLIVEVSSISKNDNIRYGDIERLKRNIRELQILENEPKKYKCHIHQEYKNHHIIIKKSLIELNFILIEKWMNNGLDSDRDKISIVCELLLEFNKNTNCLTQQEIIKIKETLKKIQNEK